MEIPYDEQVSRKMIGGVGNHYGGLDVCTYKGKRYWCIQNWDGEEWEEIPESLYNELLKVESPNNSLCGSDAENFIR